MTVMTGWDLFEDLRGAQDDLLRASGVRARTLGQLGQFYDTGGNAQPWAPAVDVTESKGSYLVTAELPGVALDDLEVTFQDGLLTVQGQRHAPVEAAGDRVHRAERRQGPFRRSIMLPTHVKSDAIEASTDNGVLQVLVPKAEEAHAKRIQVRGADRRAALTAAADNGARD